MVEKEHKAEKFGQMWLSLVLVRMRKTHSDICIERKESQGKIRPGVVGVSSINYFDEHTCLSQHFWMPQSHFSFSSYSIN